MDVVLLVPQPQRKKRNTPMSKTKKVTAFAALLLSAMGLAQDQKGPLQVPT
jgi:hypothetical protein